ncbi:MAG: hypothetical protein ACK4YP_02720 [Myxococcota bacterium]
MLLLLLVACGDPPKDDPRAEDPVPTPRVCPELDAPALATDVWERAGPLPATGLHTFATTGEWPVWVASHSTGMWRAEDGDGWDYVEAGVTHTISEVAIRPDDADYAYRSAGGVAQRTRNGGQSWEQLPLGEIIPGTASDLVWALAVTPWETDRVIGLLRSGAVTISPDAGSTWETVGYAPIHEPPMTIDMFHVWGWRVLPEAEEGGRGIVGDGFGVAVSDDGFATFTRTLDTTLAGHSLLRDPTDPAHLVVGGPDGLRESHDEGDTWTLRDIGGDIVAGAWSTDGARLAFVGTEHLFLSDDGGATFAVVDHAIPMPSAVAVLDDGTLLVADHAGVQRSDDGGATWAPMRDGLEDLGVSVIATDPSCPARVYAGSRCGGGLYLSEDYGASWTPIHDFFHYVMGVAFDPSVEGRTWAVSDDRLLRSDDGVTWDEVWRRYHFHGFALHPDEPDTLLLGSVGSGDYGDERMRVYRSVDGGGTWDDASTGLPETEASAHALHRWPGAPDVVLLGTYKAGDISHLDGSGVGLYRSIDAGLTWAKVDIEVLDVAAFGETETEVFAATNDGVWASSDEGATWEQRTGAHTAFIALGFGGPYGLALTEDGRLHVSRDAGATWEVHDDGLARNPFTTLAQVAVSADEGVAYVTVYDEGVWRIGL